MSFHSPFVSVVVQPLMQIEDGGLVAYDTSVTIPFFIIFWVVKRMIRAILCYVVELLDSSKDEPNSFH